MCISDKHVLYDFNFSFPRSKKNNAIRIHFLFCYTTIKKLQGKHKNANVRHKYYTEKNSRKIEKKNFPPTQTKITPQKTHVILKKKAKLYLTKKKIL